MSCAINLLSMAHQWRKPVCAVVIGALKEKPMAYWLRHWLFPDGAPMAQQRQMTPRRPAARQPKEEELSHER